ncbi:FAD/NAD(P)-binding protein [Nocardia crassostreae]|uniref:FAD/NAD(P)-binding protein n=1 Tax=Nocardia crassostreae TaxID=53428 RepID=UPI0008377591|nr:FAD/NAD(P)-binding protein [Nocardia crassostreae]
MHIGIVGSGAAAVALLDALAAADRKPTAVTVFDGAETLWRGRAYQPDIDAVRVNAPPPLMSVRAGDPGHYQRWLSERDDIAGYLDDSLGQPLVPRALYGRYLQDTARAAMTALRADGTRVSVVQSRVTGFTRGERAVLHTEDGAAVPVDRAVLGVGSGRPRDHYGLTGAPGYVGEPYPLARTLPGIPAGVHVAVIGSGLTAVDIAAGLTAHGHTGPITFLSRTGALPFVQQRPMQLEPRHLTPEAIGPRAAVSFAELVDLMRAELTDLGHDFDAFAAEILATGAEPPVDRLRRQLAAVDSPHLGLRLLVMLIRITGPLAWPRLPEADRALLRASHFRTINGLSSPMVPHNAKIMLRLLDSGQLRLRPGLRKLEARPGGGFTVFDDTEWTADVVLNAVNPSAYTTPQDSEPLVSALLGARAAELDPAGGLAADPATGRLSVAGRPDPTWRILGNLAATSMFIATSPPGLAAEAARLAAGLLDD